MSESSHRFPVDFLDDEHVAGPAGSDLLAGIPEREIGRSLHNLGSPIAGAARPSWE